MRTEGGQDDDVAVADRVEALAVGRVRVLLEELDVHAAQQLVDARVVDELIPDRWEKRRKTHPWGGPRRAGEAAASLQALPRALRR